MVRTQSGIEVRVTQPEDVEDEGNNKGGANDAEDVETETCGEESNGEDENRATGDETTYVYISLIILDVDMNPNFKTEDAKEIRRFRGDERNEWVYGF